jgi:hypothetical protein
MTNSQLNFRILWTLDFGIWDFLSLRSRSWEEGEDDARSACPSDTLGHTHNTIASTTGRDGVTLSQSLEKVRQFGLGAATRPHEAGIASNRGSAIPR